MRCRIRSGRRLEACARLSPFHFGLRLCSEAMTSDQFQEPEGRVMEVLGRVHHARTDTRLPRGFRAVFHCTDAQSFSAQVRSGGRSARAAAQAQLRRAGGRFNPIARVERGTDTEHVVLHRPPAQAQFHADLVILVALGEEPNDVQLSL